MRPARVDAGPGRGRVGAWASAVMIERTVPGTQAGCRGDGANDIIQCPLDRCVEGPPCASPAVIAADSVQPVPCVEVVRIRG